MSLRDKVYVIGYGQAGGNICEAFDEQGFNNLAINTSLKDLNGTKTKHKFHLPDCEGATHDRERSVELLLQNQEAVITEIQRHLTDETKIILNIASLGGGTGSAQLPLMSKYLTQIYPDKKICMAVILPSIKESLTAQYNALSAFDEISKIEETNACFVLDNNTFPDKLMINKEFVQNFVDFLSIADCDKSRYGNVDESEIETVLSAHNMAVISSIDYNKNSRKPNILQDLLSSLRDNCFAPIEQDSIIQYLLASYSDTAVSYETFAEEIQKQFGMPIDNFLTYNNRNKTIICLSGLSYCISRMKKIEERISSRQEIAANNKTASVNLQTSIKRLNPIFSTKPPKRKAVSSKELSLSDIMNQFK